MAKSYKGLYRPTNPKKYVGDPNRIVYRSLLERRFMLYCDRTPEIIAWASEGIAIKYYNPLDKRVHRYFPDFFIKYRDKNNKLRVMVIEVKPKRQVQKPNQNPKKRTKAWAYSVQTWVINQAKWKAAKEFCADRNYEFKIMTEDDLGV